MNDTERYVPGCLFLSLSALTFAAIMALSGCGSTPQQNAQRTVDVLAEGLVIADVASAQAYTDRAREALAAAADLPAYQSVMRPMDALEQGLRTGAAALRIADAAVGIWDQGGASSWPQALSCVVGALVGIRDLLIAAGVDVPQPLLAALDTVHGVVSGDDCFVDGGVQ